MLTKSDLSKIQKIINPLGKDLKLVKQDVGQVRKKLDTFIDYFDRQNIGFEKRFSRIEKTLHLPQPADF